MVRRTIKLLALGALGAAAMFAAQALPATTAHAESCDQNASAECAGQRAAPAPGVRAIVADDPVSTGALRIWTDRAGYVVGDQIRVCFSVPAPGPISITDHQSNGRVTTVWAWYDDGFGACRTATVTPPFGRECLVLRWSAGYQAFTDRACFSVYGY